MDPKLAQVLVTKGLDNISQLVERAGDFDFPDKAKLMEEAQRLLNDHHQQADHPENT